MEETKLEAVRDNNVELVQEILRDLTPLTHRSKAADELARILKEPHFQVRPGGSRGSPDSARTHAAASTRAR